MILDVGEDNVILSSEHKLRLGAKITLGIVDEPVLVQNTRDLTLTVET